MSNTKNDGILVQRDESGTGLVPNHRHCQSTVCSVFGHQEDGSTCTILQSMNLPNLMGISSGGWLECFTRNTSEHQSNNITYDIRALLELINYAAGRGDSGGFKPFTITFADAAGRVLDEVTEGDFTRGAQKLITLGRDVELKIGDQTMWKFNTVNGASAATQSDVLSTTVSALEEVGLATTSQVEQIISDNVPGIIESAVPSIINQIVPEIVQAKIENFNLPASSTVSSISSQVNTLTGNVTTLSQSVTTLGNQVSALSTTVGNINSNYVSEAKLTASVNTLNASINACAKASALSSYATSAALASVQTSVNTLNANTKQNIHDIVSGNVNAGCINFNIDSATDTFYAAIPSNLSVFADVQGAANTNDGYHMRSLYLNLTTNQTSVIQWKKRIMEFYIENKLPYSASQKWKYLNIQGLKFKGVDIVPIWQNNTEDVFLKKSGENNWRVIHNRNALTATETIDVCNERVLREPGPNTWYRQITETQNPWYGKLVNTMWMHTNNPDQTDIAIPNGCTAKFTIEQMNFGTNSYVWVVNYDGILY